MVRQKLWQHNPRQDDLGLEGVYFVFNCTSSCFSHGYEPNKLNKNKSLYTKTVHWTVAENS